MLQENPILKHTPILPKEDSCIFHESESLSDSLDRLYREAGLALFKRSILDSHTFIRVPSSLVLLPKRVPNDFDILPELVWADSGLSNFKAELDKDTLFNSAFEDLRCHVVSQEEKAALQLLRISQMRRLNRYVPITQNALEIMEVRYAQTLKQLKMAHEVQVKKSFAWRPVTYSHLCVEKTDSFQPCIVSTKELQNYTGNLFRMKTNQLEINTIPSCPTLRPVRKSRPKLSKKSLLMLQRELFASPQTGMACPPPNSPTLP